ncbi:Gti1/Pac2 family-domain-containing protein [Pisolithus marmoratus]|nr:Gti1/Pac2 family-domain-containing protein [Pisolithus marmoratus]
MQQPTLRNVRVRSTRDALQIFYAVARKSLPLITRRLDAEERRSIVPGNVYVWEERSANTEATGLGMERWTDGMGWGPSRVRDVRHCMFQTTPHRKTDRCPTQEFLFYHQKEYELGDDPSNAATPWAQMIRSNESERLIKQTYSVRVSLPDDLPTRYFEKVAPQWVTPLTANSAVNGTNSRFTAAYFSQQKLDRLDTVDNIQGVGDVPVPDGWFRSARRDGKSRREDDLTKSVPRSPWRTSPQCLFTNTSPHRHHIQYQEAQPVPSPSACPSSPSSSSSSTPATPSPRLNPDRTSDKLVPLEYLQSLPQRRRDPIDEQFLQRFSTRATTSTSPPSKTSPSTYSQLGRFQPLGHP